MVSYLSSPSQQDFGYLLDLTLSALKKKNKGEFLWSWTLQNDPEDDVKIRFHRDKSENSAKPPGKIKKLLKRTDKTNPPPSPSWSLVTLRSPLTSPPHAFRSNEKTSLRPIVRTIISQRSFCRTKGGRIPIGEIGFHILEKPHHSTCDSVPCT